MKKETHISMDEWRAALEDVARTKIDEVPPGWVTVEALCHPGAFTKSGISDVHARKLIRNLITAGKAERKKFVVEIKGTGVVRPIYHYRLKK